LNRDNQHITVYEHESIRFDKGEKRITKEQFEALEKYYGKGVPYFNLQHNGIQFNEYVGVIQIGKTIIEVLPKADKSDKEEYKWRNILLGMLKVVGSLDIKATSDSDLKIKPNTILDLYFEMFIKEVEYLLHNGLIKQYSKLEGNVTALKGNILFGKHLQKNLTHQERFYVRYSIYGFDHKLHFILYKAIQLLKKINTNSRLYSRISSLLLHFPEMPDIKIIEATFGKMEFTRKNQSYKRAFDIARLLLLQYHPDINKGGNDVLALMFDMNKLWEQFVCASLRKFREENSIVTSQDSKYFWKPKGGLQSKIRPDIVINKDRDDCVVLDTKWKNLQGFGPSPEDLRQMYVYHEYYRAKKVALVYPGSTSSIASGYYLDPKTELELNKECSIISIPVETNIRQWQKNICCYFANWMVLPD
jgi:5-methylcytosine-specific restriction enzyme subunit McrC